MRTKSVRVVGTISLLLGIVVTLVGGLFMPAAVLADGNAVDPPVGDPIPPGDSLLGGSGSVVEPYEEGGLWEVVTGFIGDLF